MGQRWTTSLGWGSRHGIRERGVEGSPVNQYAPFYLWADAEGMSRFLWGGGGFGGIIDSFGRPAVRHWTGVAFQPGPADTVARAVAELTQHAATTGVHSTALAVDPQNWQLVHFTLWENAAPHDSGARYQVLHLSNPHMDTLPTLSGQG